MAQLGSHLSFTAQEQDAINLMKLDNVTPEQLLNVIIDVGWDKSWPDDLIDDFIEALIFRENHGG